MLDWNVVAVGVGLIAFGVAMIVAHVRSWRTRQQSELDDWDRAHYRSQFRRRTQTSALIVVLGVLIPLGDSVLPLARHPVMFAIFWAFVLLLTTWVMVLALGDLASSRAHNRVALARVKQRQRELTAKLNELRGQLPDRDN